MFTFQYRVFLTSDNAQLSGLGLDSLLKGIVAATVSSIFISLDFCSLSSCSGSGQDLQRLGARQLVERGQKVGSGIE